MGLTRVAVRLRNFSSSDSYQSQFLVGNGATDSLAPASELKKIGIKANRKNGLRTGDGNDSRISIWTSRDFIHERNEGRTNYLRS